jgi:hypothetical protein
MSNVPFDFGPETSTARILSVAFDFPLKAAHA